MEKTIKRNRVFSTAFKLSVVEEVLRGEASKYSICKKYSLTGSVLYSWLSIFAPEVKYTPLENKQPMEDPAVGELEFLKKQLREKELALKKEKMRGDFYQTMVEVAEEEFKIDIRKKAGTKQ